MKLHVFGATDKGLKRKTNEDAYLIDSEHGLFVVCDGMGGHLAGEVAAQLAIETISNTVKNDENLKKIWNEGRACQHILLKAAENAILQACSAVYKEARAKDELRGMGCTATVLLIYGRKAAMAHVGDSSLFLCRDDETERLNATHTYAADLVRAGAITREQAVQSRYANVLTRSLGTHESVQCDKLVLDVLPDDVFLLCSDGLSRYLESDNQLTSYLSDDLPESANELVAYANSCGGKDNTTVVVVQAEAESFDPATDKKTRAIATRLSTLRKVELFQDLSLANLIRLANMTRLEAFDEGQIAVSPAVTRGELYIVVDGKFAQMRDEGQICSLAPGEAVGYEGLFGSNTWRTNLVATTDGTLASLDGAKFRKLLRRRPWLGVKLLLRLSQHLITQKQSV